MDGDCIAATILICCITIILLTVIGCVYNYDTEQLKATNICSQLMTSEKK